MSVKTGLPGLGGCYPEGFARDSGQAKLTWARHPTKEKGGNQLIPAFLVPMCPIRGQVFTVSVSGSGRHAWSGSASFCPLEITSMVRGS